MAAKIIPLWLAAHMAADVVARIQLTAAWHNSDLNRPGCMESVEVWIEDDGTPRGLAKWGYADVISWPYQAISWAAGPIAEAKIRGIDPWRCLEESDDYDMLMHYAERGVADPEEAFREGSRIVEECWPDIEKLAGYLQEHPKASFEPISKLLDLPNRRPIYSEHTRPDTDRRRHGAFAVNPVRAATQRRRRAFRCAGVLGLYVVAGPAGAGGRPSRPACLRSLSLSAIRRDRSREGLHRRCSDRPLLRFGLAA